MRTPIGVAMSALVALAALQAFAPRASVPLAPSQLPVQRMHVNALAQTQVGLLMGGEIGNILYSRDGGATWVPASVAPQRQALLTKMRFAPDGLTGMAIGHEGWILRSEDGGLNWREVAFDEKNGEPLLGIARKADGRWLAVGSFGRALLSDPKGQTWTRLTLPAEVEDKHLNAVATSVDGGTWLIVGERGLVLRSADGGENWTAVEPFYSGSFYNAVSLPDGTWVIYGMRGNAFRSTDQGVTWTPSRIPAPISFFGHAIGRDGRLELVGQGGTLATSTDAGQTFTLKRTTLRANLTDIVLLGKDQGIVASSAGLHALQAIQAALPSPSPARTAP